MKHYNRALDLMAAAALLASQGKVESAAKAFTAASKDKSLTAALKIIEASNRKAFRAAVQAGRIKAADQGIAADEPGEEFRVDVKENGDRVVQEAAAKVKAMRAQARKLLTRADAMEEGPEDDFLDGDEDLEAASDEDGDLDLGEIDTEPTEDDDDDVAVESNFIKAFGARAAAKAVQAKTGKTSVNAGSFARAVRNLNALK